MAKRVPKTHLQDLSKSHAWPACRPVLVIGGRTLVSKDLKEVTCKRCQRLAGNKTYARTPAQSDSFDVVLEENGPARINVIKIIRELTSLGLKESKDISDKAYDSPQIVLGGVTALKANSARLSLARAGAIVLVCAHGTRIAVTVPAMPSTADVLSLDAIQAAYHEMLACFMPAYVNNQQRLERLEEHDDSREWPTCWSRVPKVADLKRWVQAGGSQS